MGQVGANEMSGLSGTVSSSMTLVLVEANPLADINNTRKITALILADQLIDKPELQRLLAT